MTGPASLVPVSVRMAAAAAALLALGLVLACDNAAEEVVPQPTATATPAASGSSTPIATSTATPAPVTATPVSVPSGWWEYTDPAGIFSLPIPQGSVVSEGSFDLTNTEPVVRARTILFSSPKGKALLSLAIAPNDARLSVDDWVRTYPGWPSEPTEVAVAGGSGLLFPIDQTGANNPTAYFAAAGQVFALRGNITGGALDPGIFTYALDNFRVLASP